MFIGFQSGISGKFLLIFAVPAGGASGGDFTPIFLPDDH